METKKVYNLHSTSLVMMLENMTKHSNGGPGQGQILADMKRLTDSVNALAVLATDTNPEISREQREAHTMKAADKLGAILPTVTERLENLKVATEEAFELAFVQNSGLVQNTARAQEIRAHIKTLAVNDRPAFIQALFKDNDDESLGAVIFAMPYLSGLDATSHARLKQQIEKTRLPELSENREMFTELASNLAVAIHTAEQATIDFGNSRKLADMAERAVRVAEAQARLDSATLPGV